MNSKKQLRGNWFYVLDWRAGFRLSLYKNEGSNPSRTAFIHGPEDDIGRVASLSSWFRKVSGFESHRGYKKWIKCVVTTGMISSTTLYGPFV